MRNLRERSHNINLQFSNVIMIVIIINFRLFIEVSLIGVIPQGNIKLQEPYNIEMLQYSAGIKNI